MACREEDEDEEEEYDDDEEEEEEEEEEDEEDEEEEDDDDDEEDAYVDTSKPFMIFAGNPGAGKSTIINSWNGSTVFQSGVNLGKGLTKCLQTKDTGSVILADTPGLSDVSLRTKAAAAITKVLRLAHNAKLFFVVTLESGRVRPVDVTTINLVLQSIAKNNPSIVENKFGIIINKVTPGVMKKMQVKNDAVRVYGSFTGTYKTCYFHLNLIDADLDDVDNAISPLSPEFKQFLASIPPLAIIDPEPIGTKLFSTETKKMENEIKRINNAANEQLQTLRDEIRRLKDSADQQKRQQQQQQERNRQVDPVQNAVNQSLGVVGNIVLAPFNLFRSFF